MSKLTSLAPGQQRRDVDVEWPGNGMSPGALLAHNSICWVQLYENERVCDACLSAWMQISSEAQVRLMWTEYGIPRRYLSNHAEMQSLA